MDTATAFNEVSLSDTLTDPFSRCDTPESMSSETDIFNLMERDSDVDSGYVSMNGEKTDRSGSSCSTGTEKSDTGEIQVEPLPSLQHAQHPDSPPDNVEYDPDYQEFVDFLGSCSNPQVIGEDTLNDLMEFIATMSNELVSEQANIFSAALLDQDSDGMLAGDDSSAAGPLQIIQSTEANPVVNFVPPPPLSSATQLSCPNPQLNQSYADTTFTEAIFEYGEKRLSRTRIDVVENDEVLMGKEPQTPMSSCGKKLTGSARKGLPMIPDKDFTTIPGYPPLTFPQCKNCNIIFLTEEAVHHHCCY